LLKLALGDGGKEARDASIDGHKSRCRKKPGPRNLSPESGLARGLLGGWRRVLRFLAYFTVSVTGTVLETDPPVPFTVMV
jgi:hypothetical protein